MTGRALSAPVSPLVLGRHGHRRDRPRRGPKVPAGKSHRTQHRRELGAATTAACQISHLCQPSNIPTQTAHSLRRWGPSTVIHAALLSYIPWLPNRHSFAANTFGRAMESVTVCRVRGAARRGLWRSGHQSMDRLVPKTFRVGGPTHLAWPRDQDLPSSAHALPLASGRDGSQHALGRSMRLRSFTCDQF